MVCTAQCRTDCIFCHLLGYGCVLRNCGTCRVDFVLYLAGTAGAAAVVDVSGAKTVGDK